MRKRYIVTLLVLACSLTFLGCERKETEELDISEELAELDEVIADLEDLEFNYDIRSQCYADLYVENEYISIQHQLSKLLNDGFSTDINTEQYIESCIVSDEFEVEKEGASLKIKIVNPYENPVPASECLVCYVALDDMSSKINFDSKFYCGTATMEEIKSTYYEPYQESANQLIYKTSIIRGITIDVGAGFGEKILSDDASRDVKCAFENGILSKVEIEAPALLYNGLQDNVDRDKLENMTSDSIEGTLEVRRTVLDELLEVFNEAEININLNETTGEVVMDDTLLFAIDEYELSDEGKAYLDKFISIYAKILLEKNNLQKLDSIVFEGHTDTAGSYEYNLELSQKRADAVLEYCLLSEANGLSESQKVELKNLVETVGYSYTDPVFDEYGNVDADASRRVVVKFLIDVE